MIRVICCCLLALLSSVGLAAQQADPRESKLMVLERLWNEAQVNRDSSALDALVSSRFVNTEWDGEISDKQRFLADIKDPRFKPTLANIQDVEDEFLRRHRGGYRCLSHAGNLPGQALRPRRPLHRHLGDGPRQMAVRRQPYQPAQEVSRSSSCFRALARCFRAGIYTLINSFYARTPRPEREAMI